MNKGYWMQRASTWVSAAVLAGGLTTAVILVMLFRFQAKADQLSTNSAQSQALGSLDERSY